MIIKYFEINKLNLKHNNLILFYGKNEGPKNETIEKITKNKVKLVNYDEEFWMDVPYLCNRTGHGAYISKR